MALVEKPPPLHRNPWSIHRYELKPTFYHTYTHIPCTENFLYGFVVPVLPYMIEKRLHQGKKSACKMVISPLAEVSTTQPKPVLQHLVQDFQYNIYVLPQDGQ